MRRVPDFAVLAARLSARPRTRFAPSPTGWLHLGHVVNAIYTWGVAGALGGAVLVRIEDHDRERSRPEYERAMIDELAWLGFWPEDETSATAHMYARQSDRGATYARALAALEARGLVYACGCSRKQIEQLATDGACELRYSGTCRDLGLRAQAGTGLRLRLEAGQEQFEDALLGPQVQNPAAQSGDLLIRDRVGQWTYQFAVTVDDTDQHIDLVIRGADLLASTGRQIRLARLLGRTVPPVFLHHPLLHGDTGVKLSKSNRDTGIRELRAQGLSPADVIGLAAARAGLIDRPRPVPAGDVSGLIDAHAYAAGGGVNRREFLKIASAAGTALAGEQSTRAQDQPTGAPAVVTAERLRPLMTSGVQVGDVTAERAIVWSRTDRPARMVVEYGTHESFRGATTVEGPAALEDTDYTARIDLGGLPPGEMVFYRVRFDSLTDAGARSEPVTGRFRTPSQERRRIKLAWSADTVGQGWGINPELGGLRTYETMLRHDPDVFVNSGDMIYADGPLLPEVPLADGRIWKNLVTPAKSKVAETLQEFRGNYAYNLLDEHMRRFNAAVPMLAQWDDHEVMNNWHPGLNLEANPEYTDKSIALLAARAKRAMFEYVPFRSNLDEAERVYRAYPYGPRLEVFLLDERSYRGTNGTNREAAMSPATAMLGREQLDWLKARLLTSLRHVEGDGDRHAARAHRAGWRARRRSRRSRPGPTAKDRRSGASWNWRSSCRSSGPTAFATSCGSPPTSTTRRRCTTTRHGPSRRTSCRSGNSWPGRCTPATSARTPSTPRSDRK